MQGFKKILSYILKYWVFSLVISTLLVGFKSLDNKAHRYRLYPHIHSAIESCKGQVDYAFLGRSNMASSIKMNILKEEFSKYRGQIGTKVFSNLAAPKYGIPFYQGIAEDVLENCRLDSVVIDFSPEEMTWNSSGPYDQAHLLLSLKRWPEFYWNNSHKVVLNWFQEMLMASFKRIGWHLEYYLGKIDPEVLEQRLQARNSARITVLEDKSPGNEDIGAASPRYESLINGSSEVSGYFHDLMEFFHEKNIRIFLLYLPQFSHPPPSKEMKNSLEEVMRATVISPPVEVIEGINQNKQHFDLLHLNKDGAEIYSNWVANQLLSIELEREREAHLTRR